MIGDDQRRDQISVVPSVWRTTTSNKFYVVLVWSYGDLQSFFGRVTLTQAHTAKHTVKNLLDGVSFHLFTV